MNFLDTYDIAGTSTPPHSTAPEQSLNEEVTQVIGQLGRFWGGFRQQSQSALGEVVSQAQKELSKLTNEVPQESTSEEKCDVAQAGSASDADSTPPSSTPSMNPPPTSTSLFARLQSALPPSIVSTVQNNIPETLKHASESLDLAQLRTTLSNEFQRVQGVTRAQAEEYVHKSEGMFREAMKEAGEVLRDAVKVIPPEEGVPTGPVPGFVWDGTDMWMLPTPVNELAEVGSGNNKGKGRDSGASSGRPSGEAQRAVATRAEALLKRLKRDPEIIKHDPEADEGVRALYNAWLQTEVDVKEGGIEGDEWSGKVSNVLGELGDGQALQATRDALVPSKMTNDIFWKRYFFRAHQIEQEEEKRKALLQGSIESEEVFSWEDDDDDSSPIATAAKSTAVQKADRYPPESPDNVVDAQPDPTSNIAREKNETPTGPGTVESTSRSQTATPANTSPRLSSESGGSYDVVSNVSGGEGKPKKGDSDDVDSDWE